MVFAEAAASALYTILYTFVGSYTAQRVWQAQTQLSEDIKWNINNNDVFSDELVEYERSALEWVI